jgi:hypothetical protein
MYSFTKAYLWVCLSLFSLLSFSSDEFVFLHQFVIDDIHVNDFNEFYNSFSDAVENKDYERVSERVSFPLEVRGELDDDYEFEIQPKDFSNFFKLMMRSKYHVIIEDKEMSMSYEEAILARMMTVSYGIDEVDVDGIRFSHLENKWMIHEIYLPSEALDKLKQGGF